MTSVQIHSLTTAQLGAFTSAQMAALTSAQVPVLMLVRRTEMKEQLEWQAAPQKEEPRVLRRLSWRVPASFLARALVVRQQGQEQAQVGMG
jgi:hypothetical protein